MAKSIRSKWKRKMRAIKRVRYDEKILIRTKKMLADHDVEEKQRLAHLKKEERVKADAAAALAAAEGGIPTEEVAVLAETGKEMEVESEGAPVQQKKKRKCSLKTMRNEDNQYPVWMSAKKIKRHVRLMKKKDKRNTKTVKMSRNWKLAIS